LYRHTIARQYEERKFLAAIHGIDVGEKKDSRRSENSNVLFKDPKEYEGLSEKEKEKLTQNMMGKIPALFKGKL